MNRHSYNLFTGVKRQRSLVRPLRFRGPYVRPLCLVSLVLWLLTPQSQAQTPTFSQQQFQSGDVRPLRIYAADLDRDGRRDLVTANSVYQQGVSVLLNDGNGGFNSSSPWTLGGQHPALAIGNFDGNDTLDMVVPDGANNLLYVLQDVYKPDGWTSLSAKTSFFYAYTGVPKAMVMADFTGDNRDDILLANAAGDLSLIIISSSNQFQSQVSFGAGTNANSLTTGDFNGDGKLDFVTTHPSSNSAGVFFGNGDSTFQAPLLLPTGTAPQSTTVSDVNKDGKLDLLVANGGSNFVSLFLGNGNLTFQPAQNITSGNAPYQVAAADINLDGNPDLAVVNKNDNSVSVLLGNGAGGFSLFNTLQCDTRPESLVAVDVTGEGSIDIAVANSGTTTVSIFFGVGSGIFLEQDPIGIGAQTYAATTGDFNGDGKEDIATSSYRTGSVEVQLGNGDGTFQSAVSTGNLLLSEGYITGFTSGDFNRDGRLDLVANAPVDDLYAVLLGNGDGTFTVGQRYSTSDSSAVPRYFGRLKTGDFNGDSILDLTGYFLSSTTSSGTTTVYNYKDSVVVMTGNSDGTFQPLITIPTGHLPRGIDIADFNRDGKLDIVSSDSSTVSVHLGNGDGTFQPYMSLATGGQGGGIQSYDFNGDANPDLAVITFSPTTLSVNSLNILLGNGDGSFSAPVAYFNSSASGLGGIADFNGDGKVDIVATRIVTNASSAVVILPGNGDGTFGAPTFTQLDIRASVKVWDFNRDGKTDLLAVGSFENFIVSLTNTTPGTFAGRSSTAIVAAPAPNTSLYLNAGVENQMELKVTQFTGGSFLKLQTFANTPPPYIASVPAGLKAAKRYYYLSTDASIFNVDIALPYDLAEVFAGDSTRGGLDEDSLRLFRYDSTAAKWTEMGGEVNKALRQVSMKAVSRFSPWMIGTIDRTALSNPKDDTKEDGQSKPFNFRLDQNYPNPFNPETVIGYQLAANSEVSLKVFDVLGREVATLVSARQAAGNYSVRLNAATLSSGVYFYRLEARSSAPNSAGSGSQAGILVATKKMLLVK